MKWKTGVLHWLVQGQKRLGVKLWLQAGGVVSRVGEQAAVVGGGGRDGRPVVMGPLLDLTGISLQGLHGHGLCGLL